MKKEELMGTVVCTEKTIAIYEAIIAMINEGVDVNEMKVGDITNRAGIGKGTAYEYFQSKDEMVEKALYYNVNRQIGTAQKLVTEAGTFRDKFMAILDYMEDNKDQIRTFLWMTRIAGNSIDISHIGENSEECALMQERIANLVMLADWFLAFGDAEGLFKETNHDFRVSALLAQIVQFGFYLHYGNKTDMDALKNFIYEGFVKQLS